MKHQKICIDDFILDQAEIEEKGRNAEAETADAVRRVRYLPSSGVIRIMVHEFYAYDIDVEGCRDIVGILRWLFHLQEKPWMTGAMLRRFAKLICEVNGYGEVEAMPWRG